MTRSFFALLLASCTDTAPPAVPPAAPLPVCAYTADVDGVAVGWSAFKFTEKIGVAGGFRAVTIAGAQAAPEEWRALDGLTFDIATDAVDSKNPERDQKIREQLFGTMADTTSLRGSLSVSGPSAGSLRITMNGATHAVPVTLAAGEGGTWSLRGTLDLTTWNAGSAVDALNRVCEDLHKGADGLSKLWPDVEISATIPVKKDCPPAP